MRVLNCQPLREAVSWNILLITYRNLVMSQPLREAVSWNIIFQVCSRFVFFVSLFVRLWVEIIHIIRNHWIHTQSASSWGCELKCICSYSWRKGDDRQPLREAVSWNDLLTSKLRRILSQPLREAVSWNNRHGVKSCFDSRQPLREAVSWNWKTLRELYVSFRQPLREAVSWNTTLFDKNRHFVVSLFVRLWVEIPLLEYCQPTPTSASSWGCELKYIPICQMLHSGDVSLFVRLWVEMYMLFPNRQCHRRKPLREAVSWNKQ